MSTISDKLAIANNKVPNVYDAGKSCKDMKDFRYYFYKGVRLDSLDYLNTCCGENFGSMFEGCTSLTTIPKLDTSKGIRFWNMFKNCTSLTTIPELDTSNSIDFGQMFTNCTSLTTIPKLDARKTTNLRYTFDGCTSLKTIPELYTSKCTDFKGAFRYCYSLITINRLDVSKCTEFTNAFQNCSALQNISFTTYSTGSIAANISFASCGSLTTQSLQNIIYALKPIEYTGVRYTLTLNSGSWEELAAVKPPDGYSSWSGYVYDGKGWNYA